MRPDSSKNCHTSLALNFPRFLIFVLRYKFSDHNTALYVNLGFSADRSTRTDNVDLYLLCLSGISIFYHNLKSFQQGNSKRGFQYPPTSRGGIRGRCHCHCHTHTPSQAFYLVTTNYIEGVFQFHLHYSLFGYFFPIAHWTADSDFSVFLKDWEWWCEHQRFIKSQNGMKLKGLDFLRIYIIKLRMS